MIQATIDCMNITTRDELHETLAVALNFPEWYGCNLDALFDVLTDITEDTELTIENIDRLSENLGTYARIFQKVLIDASYENEHLTIITILDEE